MDNRVFVIFYLNRPKSLPLHKRKTYGNDGYDPSICGIPVKHGRKPKKSCSVSVTDDEEEECVVLSATKKARGRP